MADNTNRLAGVAYLNVDGRSYALVGDFSYSVSTVKREGLSGMDGPHGYKETPQFGWIKAKLRDSNKTRIQDLVDMTNVTTMVELANGKTVIARNAFTSEEPPAVDGSEGAFDVQWSSADVTEA
ncbi:phage tail tube protein [Phenylobacterium sp.]|uniref:phage tail tube protein n=1 Tax=Phenylobacterium sp. TaxID=1871053 RepID=UPI0035B171E7